MIKYPHPKNIIIAKSYLYTESILKHFDPQRIRIFLTGQDGNHVKTNLPAFDGMLHEEDLRGLHDLFLLCPSYGHGRMTEGMIRARFDLDENQHIFVLGDEINFPDRDAKIFLQNAVALLLQKRGGGLFTFFAKIQTFFGHRVLNPVCLSPLRLLLFRA